MSKYDKMLEVNHKQSVEKIQRAKLTIQEMIEEEDKVTVPKLMQKTGLSRGFFYKNPEVRKAVDRALQLQAGMVDKRRKILDMAMDNRILQLEQQVVKLKRENETLRKENEAMRKDSRHACGLVLDNGMELLLHIGIDTVEMQGDGFEYLIKEGQEVKAGTPLIRFNRQKIKEAGYSDVTVCVITDGADEKTVHFHTGIYAQENETVIIEIE